MAPLIALVIGLTVAIVAGLVSVRAGVSGVVIAQDQVIGIAYLVAGAIAWRRRLENATGPLLMAIGCTWYIPDFQAAPMPAIASLAFATRRVVNMLSAYLLLAFPSGRLGDRRHRLVMGYVIALTAIQVPPRLLLVDRIPGVVRQVDRITTLGCDCVNPFVLVSAPGLFSRIESVTAFLTAVGAVATLGLVMLRLIEATAPMRRVLWPVL